MLQNDSKSSFVSYDGSKRFKLRGKQLKQYGGIQPDLFEPMAEVGCLQNWFPRAQKRPKVAQNAPEWLKQQFCGSWSIKMVQIVKKKVRQGWVPQESWRDQHLPKIVQKTVLWVPMDQNSRNCIEKVRTPICLMKKRTQTDSGDCRPANCWPQIYSQDIKCES